MLLLALLATMSLTTGTASVDAPADFHVDGEVVKWFKTLAAAGQRPIEVAYLGSLDGGGAAFGGDLVSTSYNQLGTRCSKRQRPCPAEILSRFAMA